MYLSFEISSGKPSASSPPYFSTLSFARSLSCCRFHPDLATPITGICNFPRLASFCSAGKIFLCAKSPLAPKNTSASDVICVTCSLLAYNPRLLYSAEWAYDFRTVQCNVLDHPTSGPGVRQACCVAG